MSMRKKYMVTLVLVVAMVVMGSFPVMAEGADFTDKSGNNRAEGINVTSSDNRINPEELHDFNRRYLEGGIVTRSDLVYTTVWAIIPTTSGNISVPSTATVPGAGSYYVRLLQACLKSLGYNPGTIDGIYGTNTKNAIIRFQKNNSLSADGIAGENTWRYIDIRVDTYVAGKGKKVPF